MNNIETEFNNVLRHIIDRIAHAVVMRLDIRERDLKREKDPGDMLLKDITPGMNENNENADF